MEVPSYSHDDTDGKSQDCPHEILYHYTDADGLRQIVESGKLRFTDTRFMNDASEYHGLFRALRSLLHESVTTRTPGRIIWNIQLPIVEFLVDFFSDPESASSGAFDWIEPGYAFCLSREKDDINQWRAYCPNGDGYAIGFIPKELDMSVRSTDKNWRCDFYECNYDESSMRVVAEGILPDIAKLVVPGTDGSLTMQLGASEVQFVAHALGFHFIKDHHFKPEKEWRFVFTKIDSPTPLKFRTRFKTLVPYVECSFSQSSIRRIVIGPTSHPGLARRSVRMLFQKLGSRYEQPVGTNWPEIETSQVPLRPS